ncbi:MAG: peroxiredoxin [Thermoanaerobaculia bacterium]|jgi:peroxiredoxin|nr:peroxiredoxin [Thermoanaerobaculia bacterium]MBP9825867.1 peroxiredoxin [Thermoanaerobaculia bacterium]
MIEVGDRIPEATIWLASAQGGVRAATGEYFAGRKILLFGLPGAFTPTCSEIHLPGYIAKAEELRAAGVEAIACLAVNDPYVMAAWGEATGATGKVDLLADGNGELAAALGLEVDRSAGGMGQRCRRFAAVVEDGVFLMLAVEPASGVTVCGADHLLETLSESSRG